MSDTETANRLPTAEEEARFWALVEAAWERLGPEPAALRRALLTRDRAADDDSVYAIDGWLDAFLDQLGQLCADLSGPELTALDRVVERKLYDIDRADVHAVIDGSDDGFLYGRGHVVALGREFYEAVRADPTWALPDGYLQGMGYFFARLHQQRFGESPRTGSGISRESCMNPAGWVDQ
jgi:hypothetical protein